MRRMYGFILLKVLATLLCGQVLMAQDQVSRQSSIGSHIAAEEVFQIQMPQIRFNTEEGVRHATVTLEAGFGEIQEQYLENRLAEYRREGAAIEFVVVGSDIKSESFEEAKRIAAQLKLEGEKISIGTENIQVPKELNYQKERVKWTIVRSAIAGTTTFVGAYVGAQIPVEYIAIIASQAALMSAAWTYNSPIYTQWVTRSGLLPSADSARSGHFQSFAKQLTASSLFLYLIKQGSALVPMYTGVTNPAAILAEASWASLKGMFSQFFFNQAINHHLVTVVASDPTMKAKMDLWKMRTSAMMALGFGVVQQLAMYGVPQATYTLMGLGAAGIIVYKYVTNVKVQDVFSALINRRLSFQALGVAGTCRFLFFY